MQTSNDIELRNSVQWRRNERIEEYMEEYGVSRRSARRAIERLEAKEVKKGLT